MQKFIRFVENILENNYASFIQRLVQTKAPVALFYPLGGDNSGVISRGRYIRSAGMNLAVCCVPENNANTRSVDGVPVVTISDFQKISGQVAAVFIDIDNYLSVKLSEHIERLGRDVLFLFDIAGMRQMYANIAGHLSDIYEVYEWLDEEDGSRENYLASITGKVSANRKYFRYANEEQYFYGPYLPKKGDIMIEGGACDGQTAIEFLSAGCEVHAFELDSMNFPKVLEMSKKYGFSAENKGLSDRRKGLTYVHRGGASNIFEPGGKDTAELIDIDTYVSEAGLPRVDFIKMDIEGSELDALKGAMKSISKWKPRMAVCVYHKPQDLWEIPQFIKSLRGDYEMAFRHYPGDGRVTPSDPVPGYGLNLDYRNRTIYEMVLYCK